VSRVLAAQGVALGSAVVDGRNGRVVANQQPNIPTTTIHVNGVVVSSLDGKPVPRVLVTSMDRRFAALTDWEGRFAFDYRMPTPSSSMLGAGSFGGMVPNLGLLLRKPGYVNENQAARVPTPTPGTTTANLQLKITPDAAIVGHVTPDSGELPNGLRVILRRRQAQEGVGQWFQAGAAQVDRNGEFRFGNLTPGDYLVMTSAWSQPAGFGRQNRPDKIRGLLPTYYPSGATMAEATRIHVGPGDTESINLRPTSATFYHVSVGVDGLNAPNFGASLGSDAGFNLGTDQSTHTVEGYLPTGSYTVRIESFSPALQPAANRLAMGPRGGNRSTSFAHLEVGSAPLIGSKIAAAPAADIQVNVTREFTNTQQQPTIVVQTGGPGHSPPPVYLDLQPADGTGFNVLATEPDAEGDTVTLHNVPEGTYHVHINASQGYVASAMSGSTNLLTTPLTVGPGGSAAPIYITLRDDFASLSCRLGTGQPPEDSASTQQPVFVLAIPLDTPEVRSQPVGFYPQPFRLPSSPVAPGHYLLVPMSSNGMQSIEYRDPAILHELMSKGVSVNLAPGAKESVDVPFTPGGDN
ncbi:MAG TPA: carboxypeptidase-like regulatory domain-containing protein, partial [Acidobacteriaceae bacterium]|nr:carboxypeptidase-like regulatory domain-containing protein [Acidobacteriaceae bacterium]